MSRKKKGKSRILKIVVVLLVLAIVLVGAIIGLLFTSPVQTGIANYFLKKQGGESSGISKVHVKPSSASLEGLVYNIDGLLIELETLTANGDLIAIAKGDSYTIDTVTVRKLTIDARNVNLTASEDAENKDSSSSSEPFEGVLKKLNELPAFSLNRADISEVTVLLPDDMRADFDLVASGFGPGKTGEIRLNTTASMRESDSIPLSKLVGEVLASITTKQDGGVSAIEATANLTPTSTQVRDGTSLQIFAKISEADQGEAYEVRAHIGNTNGESVQVASLNALLVQAEAILRGDIKIQATRDNLAPVLDTASVPAFALGTNATFRYSVKPDTLDGSLKGDLNLTLDELERLSPQLNYLGTVSGSSSFDVAVSGSSAHINALNLEVTEGNRAPLLLARLIKDFTVDYRDAESINTLSGELISIHLNDLPVSLISPLIPGVKVEGDRISGQMTLAAHNGVLGVTPKRALTASKLSVSQNGEQLLASVDVSLQPSLMLDGQTIQANLRQISVTFEGRALLEGNTALSYDMDQGGYTLEGDLSSLLSSLTAQPFANKYGKVTDPTIGFSSYIKLSGNESAINIDSLQTRLTSSTQRLVMVDTLRPFTLSAKMNPEDFLEFEGDLVKVTINKLPISIIAPYIPGYILSGDDISGGMTVAGDGKAISLTTDNKLILRNASLSEGDKKLIDNLTLELSPSVRFDGKELKAGTGPVNLSQRNVPIGTIDAVEVVLTYIDGKFVPASARAEINRVILPRLYDQPIMGSGGDLITGNLTGTLDATLSPSIKADVDLKISDVRTRTSLSSFNEVTLTLDAAQTSNTKYTAQARLGMQSPQGRSGAEFDGSIEMQENTNILTGNLKSDRLVLPDLMALLPSGNASEEPATTPAPVKAYDTTPDTAPAWAGVEGKLQVDITQIVVSEGLIVDDLRTVLSIEPKRIAISEFNGLVNETPLILGGELVFDETNPQVPYRVNNGDLELSGFNIGSFFTKANSRISKPIIESVLSFDGSFSGSAPNLGVLADYLDFDIKMKGEEGVIRPLQSLGRAGSLTSIASTILGDREDQNTITQVLDLLTEIEFADVKADLLRQDGQDIMINALEFIGNNIKVTGSGSILRTEGTSLANSSINLPLTIYTKGRVSELFNKVRLLEAAPNADGWATGPTFRQTGPLSDSSNNLRQLITSAAGRNLLDTERVDLKGDDEQADSSPSTSSEEAPQEPAAPSKEQRREEVIRGIFDLLK